VPRGPVDVRRGPAGAPRDPVDVPRNALAPVDAPPNAVASSSGGECAPQDPGAGGPSSGGVLSLLRDRRAFAGAALVTLVGVFFGVVEVLVPLRLDALGAGAVLIAGAFLVTAALQAASSPAFGRWIDRRGSAIAIRAGLVSGCVLAAAVPWPAAIWAIVALVLLMGPFVGILWLPGMTLLSESAERRGANQAYAFALVNLTWAGSALLGAAAGSALAEATTDAVPYLLLSATFLVALAVYSRQQAGPGQHV
jgi:MFS family permease